MSALNQRCREEDRDVHPTEISPVAPARGSLDDPPHLPAYLAGHTSVGRSLDLGGGHLRHRDRDSNRFLVATDPPRLLVGGGAR